MIWKPDVTVAAVVEREGRFLIVEERVASTIVLNQPAGHLEKYESLIDAVIRETLEETAWHLIPQGVVGTYLWTQPGHGDRPSRSFLRIAFRGSVTDHEPDRKLDKGILKAAWLTPQQLSAQPGRLRSPLVLKCIDDYLAGCNYPLESLTYLAENPVGELRSSVAKL